MTAQVFAVGVGTSQSILVNLQGVSFIILRLFFEDATNRVLPSFSTDGGITIRSINLPASATVMTTGMQGFVSVFGFVEGP